MIWVVADGIDGSGKSTLIEYLATLLPAAVQGPAPRIIVTREPGGAGVPGALRSLALSDGLDPVSRQQLMAVDARINYTSNVLPWDGTNTIVLQDRGAPSAAVYSGLEDPLVESYGHQGRKPDLYLWVKCDPIIAHARIAQRGAPDHFDRASLLTLQRRAQAYRNFFSTERLSVPVLEVDTNRPHNSPGHHAQVAARWIAHYCTSDSPEVRSAADVD